MSQLVQQIDVMTEAELLPLMAGVFQSDNPSLDQSKRWAARVLNTTHHAYGISAKQAMKVAYYNFKLEEEASFVEKPTPL